MKFENQVVLVTGAAGNLGRALVHGLREEGPRLVLFDHRQGRLPDLYPDLKPLTQILFVDAVDLTKEQSVQSGVDQVMDHYGRIDVVINAAGGYRGGASVEDTAIDTWDKLMGLNARSVFLVSRAILPIMRAQGSGVMVNIGARPGVEGKKNAGAYSASKSAVLRLTESMAAEVKADGVRVNAVIPGTIDTPDNREAMPNANYSRWLEPSAVADAIFFLASSAARGICGACLPVYGNS